MLYLSLLVGEKQKGMHGESNTYYTRIRVLLIDRETAKCIKARPSTAWWNMINIMCDIYRDMAIPELHSYIMQL